MREMNVKRVEERFVTIAGSRLGLLDERCGIGSMIAFVKAHACGE